QRPTAPVQRLAGTSRLRPRRLPAALGGHEPAAGAALREVSGGGLDHVLYDGGLQARLRQGALPEADAAGAPGSPAVTAAGGAPGHGASAAGRGSPGGPLGGADPAVPGTADRQPPR